MERHLSHLCTTPAVRASASHRGGQVAADAALAAFDVAGYATHRSVVSPAGNRGASALSPWIRYGLLDLGRVWDHVDGGPAHDVEAFRSELLWQEYARHLYARVGPRTRRPLRGGPSTADPATAPPPRGDPAAGWTILDPDAACTREQVDTLLTDGWITNRGRLWLASQWSVRLGADWSAGEDLMFRSLLDGSRAANRLGWQWTSGAGSSRPWTWTREQVERFAPDRCGSCALRTRCPVESTPADPGHPGRTGAESGPDRTVADPELDRLLRRDPDVAGTAGPQVVTRSDADPVRAVWLTAESLGDADPALAAHSELPAVFVFDEPLLARLRLASTRLVFLAECLADLGGRREVVVHLDDPVAALDGRTVATTAAPVPGNRRIRRRLGDGVEVHPWPWLVPPHDRSVRSFSAWRRHVSVPSD